MKRKFLKGLILVLGVVTSLNVATFASNITNCTDFMREQEVSKLTLRIKKHILTL